MLGLLHRYRGEEVGGTESDDWLIMKKYNVRLSAHKDNDDVIIVAQLDNASMVMRYTDKEEMAAIAENLEKILNYMWDDYLVREDFKKQLDEELDDWLNDGDR